MTPPPPPIPAKRPGLVQLTVQQCQIAYEAKNAGELSCNEGDIVYILSEQNKNGVPDGFCMCRIGSKLGLIPLHVIDESSCIDFPVHEASKRGNIAWLQELISTGISVNSLDAAGNCPLYWACRSGHLECVKLLLAANPVLSQQNKLGDTILHGCAWGGHKEVLSLILQQPGAIDLLPVKNKSLQTAYQLAKNYECAALLKPSSYASDPSLDYEDSDQE